jgi:hypothetical protein
MKWRINRWLNGWSAFWGTWNGTGWRVRPVSQNEWDEGIR